MMIESVTLSIGGMTCNGCAKSISNALNDIDGVTKSEVSFELAQAVIDYDNTKINKDDLIGAIDDAGFEVL